MKRENERKEHKLVKSHPRLNQIRSTLENRVFTFFVQDLEQGRIGWLNYDKFGSKLGRNMVVNNDGRFLLFLDQWVYSKMIEQVLNDQFVDGRF